MTFRDQTITDQLARMASDLHMSPSGFTFRNEFYADGSDPRVTTLTNVLYTHCYALRNEYQAGRAAPQTSLTQPADASFVAQLSANNQGSGRTEPAWTVTRLLSSTHAEVKRGHLVRTVPVSFIGHVPAEQAPVPGTTVSVWFPHEDAGTRAGFYYAFGQRAIDTGQKLLRVYWNISPEGAAPLTGWITQTLNRYRIPYIFKCLNIPGMYTRRDAAVLYIEESTAATVAKLLPECFALMEQYLYDDVPLFSYAWHCGIGAAESPGIYESLGMHRMKLVAEAALSAGGPLDGRVADVFMRHGINPAQPYLNKGSKKLALLQ